MRKGGHNPRQVRLAIEYTNLMNLASRSDVISIEALDVHPGWPPEKYLVTYRCRGIVGINDDQSPVYGDFHQVKMYLPSDYPLREPHLKWVTPIWHPNIDHEVPNHVCTNTAQNYFAGKPLSDLVRAMGEMVQYVRYHAAWVPPYPLDRAAARWVEEYAEPRGIVSKARPVDDRPLLRPQRLRLYGAAAAPPAPPAPAPAGSGRRRIRLGTSPLDPAVYLRASAALEPPPATGTVTPSASRQTTGPTLAELQAQRPSPRTSGSIARRITGALERIGLRAGWSSGPCANCSTLLPRDARFCPYCGAATAVEAMTCWNCQDGTVPPNARYCPRCGVLVRGAPSGT